MRSWRDPIIPLDEGDPTRNRAARQFQLGHLRSVPQAAPSATLQPALSQEVTASITGTVTDPSGASVPGATVTATSVERRMDLLIVCQPGLFADGFARLLADLGDDVAVCACSPDEVSKLSGIPELAILNAAVALENLRGPPGNRLEALKGDRAGQYSIRINDRYRVCFLWRDGPAYDVEIVAYH